MILKRRRTRTTIDTRGTKPLKLELSPEMMVLLLTGQVDGVQYVTPFGNFILQTAK